MGIAEIAKVIEQAGLIGLLALALGAIAFLTKKVFAQQKTIQDGLGNQVQQQKEQTEKLINLLTNSTTTSVNQINSNETLVNKFEELAREVGNANEPLSKKLEELAREVAARAPQLQALNETLKRILREANLAPDD